MLITKAGHQADSPRVLLDMIKIDGLPKNLEPLNEFGYYFAFYEGASFVSLSYFILSFHFQFSLPTTNGTATIIRPFSFGQEFNRIQINCQNCILTDKIFFSSLGGKSNGDLWKLAELAKNMNPTYNQSNLDRKGFKTEL